VRSIVVPTLALVAALALPSIAEAGARRRIRVVGAPAAPSAPVKSDEAVTEILRRTPRGGIAQLPAGAFRTAVVIDRPMTLVASPAGTTFDATGLSRPGIEVLAGVTDVVIDGVRIVGATDGLVADGGNDRLAIRRVVALGCAGRGARVASSADVTIDRATFDGNGTGGLDLIAEGARLTGLSFHANGGAAATLAGRDVELADGVLEGGAEGVRFAGLRCRVFRTTMRDVAVAARFTSTSDTSTLSRCDVRGAASLAVTDEGSMFATIEGNRVDGTSSDAVRLLGSWHVVEGNVIVRAGGAGVVGRGTSLRVTENTMASPAADGASLIGDGNTIEANKITGAGGAGVRVAGASCVIAMNECPGAMREGVSLVGAHNIVVGNRADAARLQGVLVTGDANMIQGNQLLGTGAAGIRIGGGTANVVTSNTILRCGGRGFEDAGVATAIENNRID